MTKIKRSRLFFFLSTQTHKKLLCGVTAAFLLTGTTLAQIPQPQPQPAPETPQAQQPLPPPPTLSAKSYILMDFQTGQILAEHDADLPLEPASITKVMTSYIVASEIAAKKMALTDPVFISETAWRKGGGGTDGSTSFLQLESQTPLKDLLYGMIIQSGNDASIALAEHVAGSEETFANMMNTTAKRLGMQHTFFANATGLPAEGHVSSAHDIALLSQALIRDFPEHYAMYAIKEYTLNNITQYNRNTLLWRDNTIDGIKTGHTSRAGYCLVASAQRENTRLIAVVMHTASEKIRADEAQALLNYGFRFFESHLLYAAQTELAKATLWKGEATDASLGVEHAAMVTIPRGAYEQLKATTQIIKPLMAPLKKGQQAGTVRVMLEDKIVYEAPLVALQDYPEGGFFKNLSDTFWLWWE